MNQPIDALRTLARHSTELDRARREISADRTEKLRLAERARDDAEKSIRQAEGQHQILIDEVAELASTSDTVGSIRPVSNPKQADVRAELDLLKSTWPTFQLLQASEQMESDERRSMVAGRTIQWIWLGLTVVGAVALIAAPIIIVNV